MKDHILFVVKVIVGVILASFATRLLSRFTAPKSAPTVPKAA